jgi:hypothetical protein
MTFGIRSNFGETQVMTRVVLVAGCLFLAVGANVCPTIALAQQNADPFGNLGDDVIDFSQLAPAEPAPVAGLLAVPARAGAPGIALEDLCRCVGEDSSAESAARIRTALLARLKAAGLEFIDQPLEEVINLLQEEYGIPIKLDSVALKEQNIGPDNPVSVNIHGVSLGAALRLMLREHELTYTVRDEVLLITTPDAEEKRLRTCVYDVRDLMQGTRKGNDFDSLIDSIVSCIATETWAENGGGESEIRPLQPGFLIIAQTESVHDEIRGLLTTIRHLKNRPAAVGANAALTPTPSDDVVTQSYRLQLGNAAVTDELRAQVRDLIVKAIPDERWVGRIGNGEPVVLAVVNDRVVVRHTPDVQEKVEELLVESGLAVAGSHRRVGGVPALFDSLPSQGPSEPTEKK